MAIGGLISYQNFSSFIGSGRGCRTEQAISRQRGERLGTVMSQHCPVNAFLRNSTNLGDRSSLHWCSFNHYPYDEGLWNRPLFSQYDCLDIQIRQRTQRNCKCSLHSGSFRGSWIRPRSKDELNNGCGLKSGNIRVKRLKAHYKSEEYDMTEANVDALTAAEGWSEAVLVEGNVQEVSPWWEQFPKRWVIVLLCFSAFLLCNMDRVVGGIWADRIGGKVVLGFGVVWWSVATVLTPIVARIGLPFLLVTRAFMVIGEGVAMPAMNNILSKWIPVSERSRSLALVYSGMYLGSVTGLAFSPILIKYFGWPSVFYAFGSLGSIWFAFWLRKAYSSPKDDAEVSIAEKKLILDGGTSKEPVSVIPWRLILSKAPVWALIISHFCHNWGTFILLTWMPTYYNQVLKFNLTESGLLCALPWLTMAIFANIGGWIADTLVSKGLSITAVRKIMQSIEFLGPAFFLTQLSHVKTPAMAAMHGMQPAILGVIFTDEKNIPALECLREIDILVEGSDAFSQSGLYSNHQDIGPRYAGVLLGLSNTVGVLAGVFGTAATGYILQRGSWDDVFKVAVVLYIIGTLVWNLFATGEKILD